MALFGGAGGFVGGASVRLLLDDSQFRRGLAEAEAETRSASTTMGKFGGAAKQAFLIGGVAAAAFGVASVKAFLDAQQIAAQTESAIKATGGAAGVTADQVGALATKISELSGIDDDAVQASENLLLTFRDIRNEAGKGNDIFDRTTQAIADMATAMNQGAIPSQEQLAQTTIQVGKAMNDPIKGMTALRRVGVAFSDSQVKMITHLQETGDLMGAQKIILGELTKEFGGAAKAAGDTAAGGFAKFKNEIGNVMEEVGRGLIPALQTIGTILHDLMPVISGVASNFDLLLAALVGYQIAAAIFAKMAASTAAAAVANVTFTATAEGAAAAGLSEAAAAGAVTASFGTMMIWVAAAIVAFEDLKLLVGLLTGDFSEFKKFLAVDPVPPSLAQHFIDLGVAAGLDASAVGDLTAKQSALRTEMQHTPAAIENLNKSLHGQQTAAAQAAFASRDLAVAMRELNDAERTSWALANQAAGGLLGLVSADMDAAQSRREFAAAQAKVNKLQSEGKQGTDKYAQAVRDRNAAEIQSIASQQNLEGSAQSLYAEFRKGNVSLAEADDRLRAQARSAGLSAGQTNALVDKVNALYAADKQIPRDVRTNFSAPGLDMQMNQLVAYWTALKNIPTHKDVYIVTHYSTVGTPGTAGGPQ